MTALYFNYVFPEIPTSVSSGRTIRELISGRYSRSASTDSVHLEFAVPSELLKRVGAGDEAAFEMLYRQYFRKCFSIALYFVHSRHLAEDIVAEVFLALWNRRSGLPDVRNWESFLFISVRNHALSFAHRFGRIKHDSLDMLRVSIRSAELSPEESVLRDELGKALQEALGRLPDKSRMIYYLVREERMSYHEISEILGISERTVNSHMTRAVRGLVESLQGYFKAED